MGFDAVFDTDFAADLTIMEEASELIHRLEHGGTLPMLTSCCPAWVKFIEHQFPELLDIPSTCKSPHIMMGTVVKTYYAEKMGIDPEKLVVVSVMPCIAKKAEAKRPELTKDENDNVDIVVTTREFGYMLKEAGIDFVNLPDSDFDNPLGESTGASVIFGTTGGVIEAAIRTAYDWMTGEDLEKVDFTQLRGMEGIREATVKINDMDIKIGIAHGLGNARRLLEDIRDGKSHYHAIEIMACPGGCIGGGGQPYHHGNDEIVKKRQQAIYKEDKSKKLRKSHENPEIIKLYEEYLGKPYGHKAHELLHTHYEARERI
jgi:NADH-quinone oxidoreductase subunit G/NADP-reducing hydrogenase subunit HndD